MKSRKPFRSTYIAEDIERYEYFWTLFSKVIIKKPVGDLGIVPFMIRWNLFRTPWFTVKLHHILHPDQDRDPHDHPWDFLTIILKGGYTEHHCIAGLYKTIDIPRVGDFPAEKIWSGFRIKVVNRISFHHATDLHKIVSFHDPANGAWTLFITGNRKREWGFQTPNGWVHHEVYRQYNHLYPQVASFDKTRP